MNVKNIARVDLNTGEIVDGVPVYTFAPVRNGFSGWVAVSQEAFGWLGRERLDAMECWVFFLTIERALFGNELLLCQKDIARELKTDPAAVGRAIKKLVKRGVLMKKERGKYSLSPGIGWKGKGKEHRHELRRTSK